MVENSNKTIAKVDEFPASGGFHDAAVFKLRDFRADVGGTDIPHRLEFFALVFVAQDEINGEVDFARVHMPADTLLVVQPNQVLRFSLNDAADGWLLLFKPEFLPLTSENGPTLTALLQNLPPLNRLTPERAAWCRRLITLLWQTRHINPATAPAHEVNRQLVSALILQLSLFCQPLQSGLGDNLSRRYQQFKQLLETHFARAHQVAFYTQQLGCTEKSLTAACKQMSGATPKQLIAQRLTLEAKCLLAHSKQSVHQIAFALGFNEPTNFIKFFKKYTALTPRQFRTAQKLGATR